MIAEISMSSAAKPSKAKRMMPSRHPSHIFNAHMQGKAKRATLIDETMCDHCGIATFAMKNADTASARTTRTRIPV